MFSNVDWFKKALVVWWMNLGTLLVEKPEENLEDLYCKWKKLLLSNNEVFLSHFLKLFSLLLIVSCKLDQFLSYNEDEDVI